MMSGGQRQWFIFAISLVLLVALLPRCDARRGGGFGRGGGGFGRGRAGSYSRGVGGGPSAGKVAGAAAAGAIGGAMLGSALSRPGYGYGHGGYGGYGGYGGGYGGYGGFGGGPRGGYGRGYEFEGSGDMDFYYSAASSGPVYNSIIVVIGSIFALLMGNWAAVL